MGNFFQLVLSPFSWLLTFFHDFFGSYGLAMIFFALVVKIILFPLSLKGKRSMIQMNMVSGEMQKIQTQYARNRQKMNEEMQKLYAKENVSPMGGCLWSMLPVAVLIPLYAIIRRPFYYLMHQSEESMVAIAKALNFKVDGAFPTVDNISAGYNELTMAGLITDENLSAVKAAAESVTGGLGEKIFNMNFSFLGVDLSQIPNWKLWEMPLTWMTIGLFLIPIVATACNALSMVVSQKTNAINKQSQPTGQTAQQMKMMMYTMPIMSLVFCFIMPAAMGIYWIVNSVLAMGQEVICSRLLKKDYAKAAAAKAEQERLEKEEEKRKRREAAERKARAIEEAKLNKGKKKKPAETPDKKPGTNDNGRVGMRPYARGRSYDPDRFGGVTAYRDPGTPVDEEAVQKALEKKALAAEAAAEADETVVDEIIETAELTDETAVDETVESVTEETESGDEAEEQSEK